MSDQKKFDRFKIQWIYIRDLLPHPKVQRPYRASWAKEIGENFDPDKFRPLDAVPHGQKFWVFAGQHRLGGARHALGEDQQVPCHVHEEVPIEHMAEICLGVDDMLAWQTLDKWFVRVLAKEDVPVKIEALLHRHGLRVDKSPGVGSVRAVGAMETVWTKHGGESTLERVVKILAAAYGNGKEARSAFDGNLIRGVGILVHRFGVTIDDEDLSRKLSKHSGPNRMLGASRDYAKVNHVLPARAVAANMLTVYNDHRRGASRLEF